MNDSSRTTAIGLARYAREYLEAALAADEAIGHRPGYEAIAPPPVMFLVAHSMELALKAYLLYSGMPLKQVVALGHDLIVAWQYALDNNVTVHIELTEEDIDILKLINSLHISTELRYIKIGFKQFPIFGPLQHVAEKILNGVCPLVGYR